jgi:Rrf2 family iron-sulfur cluster assembly transcriptional regulator
MICSRSAEYAIRAFVHIARIPAGSYAMVKDIAAQERIPAHFLAKILQQLARRDLLRSSKGPTGGFCLRIPANRIRLIDIVEALDGQAPYRQPDGSADFVPWNIDSWKALHSRIMEYLEQNTVADLAKAVEIKRRRRAVSKKSKTVQ